MPKATLTYQLPEEIEEYTLAVQGGACNSALCEFANQLRQWRKYENIETIKLAKVAVRFYEILQEHGVEI